MDLLLPIIIAVLLVVLVTLFLVQRRQRASNEVVPPPEFGEQKDYTNPDLKEPETFAERVRNAPLALKLLVPLALIALLILGSVLYITLQPVSGTAVTPTAAPGAVTEVNARLSNATTVLIQAATNLPNGTAVQAQLLEDGQPFAWNMPESATGSVNDGRVQIAMLKRPDAPTPDRAKSYSVTLSAADAGSGQVVAGPADLGVPQLYADDFYASGVVAAAATDLPTSAPANTVMPTPTATATATEAPTPTATASLTATVANGGNLRDAPRSGRVLDQNNALETLTLLQKTADGAWYQVTNPRGVTGWFSASLLTISSAVADQVPVEGSAPPAVATTSGTVAATTPTVTIVPGALVGVVRNGGNLRSAPNLSSNVLDQNNADEVVTLVAKNSSGTWYRLTNPRGVTGWFSASLLTIEPSVAAQVTVQP